MAEFLVCGAIETQRHGENEAVFTHKCLSKAETADMVRRYMFIIRILLTFSVMLTSSCARERAMIRRKGVEWVWKSNINGLNRNSLWLLAFCPSLPRCFAAGCCGHILWAYSWACQSTNYLAFLWNSTFHLLMKVFRSCGIEEKIRSSIISSRLCTSDLAD